MSQASRDQNFVPSALGVSSADSSITIPFTIDSSTGRLKTDTAGSSNIVVGTSTVTGGVSGRVLYDNAGVLGEMTTTGSGTVLALATSPVFTTPNIGSATGSISGNAGTTTALLNARTIGGVSFDGTTNITVATATGGFTVSGGALALSANNITMTGSLAATGARVTKGWFTDVESTNMYTVGGISLSSTFAPIASPTFTGTVTLPATTAGGVITLSENSSIALDPAGSADGKYTGITISGTAGTTLAFGDLIYLAVADSRWELADADALATAGNVMMGMCVLAAAADASPTNVLLMGQIRADAKFPALTIGAAVYAGETAGAIQVAIPIGADNVIRVVGFALTADEIYFNPSQDHQTTVA